MFFLNMDELERFNVGHLQVVVSKRSMVWEDDVICKWSLSEGFGAEDY